MFRVRVIIATIILTIASFTVQAQEDAPTFPIPKFLYPDQNTQSAALKTAMDEMREVLCRKQEPVSAGWRQSFADALNKVIVAEHAVVWAAAGDLASDEKNTLRGFYTEKDALITLLERLVAENPELQPAINRLKTVPDPNTEAAAGSSFGLGILTVYALRTQLYEVERTSWQTMASISDGPAYKRLVNRALRILGEVQFRLYIRGKQIIDRDTPADASFPFVLYLPAQTTDNKLDIAIAQKFITSARIRGVSASGLVEFDDEYKWQRVSGIHSVQFDEAAEAKFRKGCSGKQMIRLNYQPSRESDARTAAEKLRANNYTVELNRLNDNATLDHKNKIYYQKNGSRTGAEFISQLLTDTEALNPAQGTDGASSPDYSIWIVGKNPSAPRGKTVRIVYFQERSADAQTAAKLLRLNGFTVNEVWNISGTGESKVSPSYQHLLLCSLSIGATTEEANEIVEIVKNVERLVPRCETTVTAESEAEYVLWMISTRGRRPNND